MRRALFFLSFSCLAIAQSPAPADWRFAQPDADIKGSVNLHAVLTSAAAAKAIEQIKAQSKNNTAQIDLVVGMLRTVDRVSFSGRQKAPNDMDALAEVTGSFDPQLVMGLFPSTGPSKVKAVGPHTILIGEGDSFTAAVARLDGSAPSAPADDFAASDIWFEANAAFLSKQSGQAMPPMLQDLRSVALGLTLSDSPVLDVVLDSSGADAARKLLATLNIINSAAAGSRAMASIAKNLSLAQDGSKVKMHVVIPPEVMAMIQEQAKSAVAGGAAPPQLAPLLGILGLGGASAGAPGRPAPAAGAAPPPPQQNGGAIRIYGLDDGPKEIQAPK